MQLITYTNLFPDKEYPRHGVFVRERLNQLVRQPGVTAAVVALRPGWRNTSASRDPSGAPYPVRYQFVPTLPKVTNWMDPWLWARASMRAVRESMDGHDSVLLDAQFLYPDGVAATIIGRTLGIPVVLTARGSDVNVKCENPVMRRWVRWSAARSDALITVSGALLVKLRAFGVHCTRMLAIPNGVDVERFEPQDKSASRLEFDVGGHVLLSVGHLVREKGHHLAIGALARLPETTLVVAGEGPERHSLAGLASRAGVADRVRFLGTVDPGRMPYLYSAADAVVLASVREGMPNVVLESLACGTPVIASAVGGIPEVLTSRVAGRLIDDLTESGIVSAVREIRDAAASTEAVRKFAMDLRWQPRAAEQVGLYRSVLESHKDKANE